MLKRKMVYSCDAIQKKDPQLKWENGLNDASENLTHTDNISN